MRRRSFLLLEEEADGSVERSEREVVPAGRPSGRADPISYLLSVVRSICYAVDSRPRLLFIGVII